MSNQGLGNAPPEILEQILEELIEPTNYHLGEGPDTAIPGPADDLRDLKAFSLASSYLRKAALPRLFKRIQLSIKLPKPDVLPIPAHESYNWMHKFSDAVEFIHLHRLESVVESFTLKVYDRRGYYRVEAISQEDDSHQKDLFVRQQWVHLLASMPSLKQLTIEAPPYCMESLCSADLNPYIHTSWSQTTHTLSVTLRETPEREPGSKEWCIRGLEYLPCRLTTVKWKYIRLNQIIAGIKGVWRWKLKYKESHIPSLPPPKLEASRVWYSLSYCGCLMIWSVG